MNGQTRCPKDVYDSPLGLCTGKIFEIPRVIGLLRIQARLHGCHVFFLFAALLRFVKANHIEFKFVARQNVASVVIRAAKLRFAAESGDSRQKKIIMKTTNNMSGNQRIFS